MPKQIRKQSKKMGNRLSSKGNIKDRRPEPRDGDSKKISWPFADKDPSRCDVLLVSATYDPEAVKTILQEIKKDCDQEKAATSVSTVYREQLTGSLLFPGFRIVTMHPPVR